MVLNIFTSHFVRTKRSKIRANKEINHWYFRISTSFVNNHFANTHDKKKNSNLREINLTNQFIVGKGNDSDMIMNLQVS